MSTVIQIENLSKYYRLGLIGGGTLREDVNRWLAKLQGKPDPLLKVGETDHGNRKDGQIWALRDINLEVKEGEILGIIGRNGAGKSTLLKILSRITAPTEGRIKIKGRVGSLLEVGTGFHPELTGRENIYLNGTILGMSKAEVTRKLDEIVEFAEMAQFIDTPVKRYSSGMTVRLAFAVAAHLEPEILVIDEVLAVGDAAFQKKCLGKMEDVSRAGRTVLFVSHNMASIEALCSRVVLLNAGYVEYDGETQEGVAKYISTAVAATDEPLSLRKDRKGNGRAIITDFYFCDEEGNRQDIILSGKSVLVRIEYIAEEELRNIRVGFNIYERPGEVLMNFNSQTVDGNIDAAPSRGILTCFIPKFPIRAGCFFGNATLQVAGEISDWVQSAFRINVEAGDFYGTGKLPSQGKLLTEYSWTLQ